MARYGAGDSAGAALSAPARRRYFAGGVGVAVGGAELGAGAGDAGAAGRGTGVVFREFSALSRIAVIDGEFCGTSILVSIWVFVAM